MVINNTIATDGMLSVHKEMRDFVNTLIHHLRLLKNGDITCTSLFQIDMESRKVIQRFKPRFTAGTQQKFEVDDNDVIKFKERFSRISK